MTKNISILALGDSYIVGEGIPGEDSFPYQLSSQLQMSGFKPFVQIVAKTGWTSGELLKAMEEEEYLSMYSFVFLLVGVNNQYRGLSIENYKGEFKILLDKAIYFAGDPKKVIVISIPDWGATPFGEESGRVNISGEIDLFNHFNHKLTIDHGCFYLYITSFSREIGKDRDYLAPDELHYSSRFYKFIVDEVMDYIMLIKN